jgi:hypothetical protein
VWNPAASIDQAKRVPIPSPGSATDVSFSVPPADGYHVGVLAMDMHTGSLVAAGRTDGFTVVAGQENRVSVNVQPFEVVALGPDTLRPGQQATYLFRFRRGGPISGMFSELYLGHGVTPWTGDWSHPGNAPMGVVDDSTMAAAITVPTVTSDTAIHMQLYFRSSGIWPVPNAGTSQGIAYYPSLANGQALFRRPVKVPSTGVIVTFDRSIP